MGMIQKIKNNFVRIMRFGIVGGLGCIVNIFIFVISKKTIGVGDNIAAIMAFSFAVTGNYLLNHIWTFKEENSDVSINTKYYFSYVCGNIVGLLVNLG